MWMCVFTATVRRITVCSMRAMNEMEAMNISSALHKRVWGSFSRILFIKVNLVVGRSYVRSSMSLQRGYEIDKRSTHARFLARMRQRLFTIHKHVQCAPPAVV